MVLYAPTWQQDDKGRELFPFGESQGAFIECLSDVCRQHDATLIIRSHLNANIEARGLENVRYCSMKDFPDTEGLLMLADILICDWSSIAFDYLALDRPTIFLEVEPPFRNGFSLGKEYRFGAIAEGMTPLKELLGSTLRDPDTYFDAYANSHKRVTELVYGENTDGKVAHRQLKRLFHQLSSGLD